ncbi:MAG: ATP-dependent 6-phosphofructokinase [Deltaproteobacteria bacterium]|nr:ATP-dependent 6-phosphofructokinase [Deltaproteobacteria bacterium]
MAPSTVKTIGILTGGGDCPGLNSAIKAAVHKICSHGFRVQGILDGWRGLLEDRSDMITELTDDKVRTIDRTGGTVLGTSRVTPYMTDDGRTRMLERMDALDLHSLIVIGGNGTLAVANRLFNEHGVKVVGIPKTIDRDLSATGYSLGFESAVQIVTDSIDNLRATAGSHRRIFVMETMGRHTGHLALKGGIAGGAAVILIPEVPFEVERVCKILRKRHAAGLHYGIVVVAEGAYEKGSQAPHQSGQKDTYGHVRLGGISGYLAEEIESRTGLETRNVILSHLQRGGPPVAYDRRLGFYFGTAAAEATLSGLFGMMPSIKEGRVGMVSLDEAVGRLSAVDVRIDYDADTYCHSHRLLESAEE